MRKERKRNAKIILLILNIVSFGLRSFLFIYMNSIVTPALLLGPAFVISLWDPCRKIEGLEISLLFVCDALFCT